MKKEGLYISKCVTPSILPQAIYLRYKLNKLIFLKVYPLLLDLRLGAIIGLETAEIMSSIGVVFKRGKEALTIT